MTSPRRFVYIAKSDAAPGRYYTGLTSDVATRLEVHNSGGSQHTAGLRPWRLVVSLEFVTEASAVAFESTSRQNPDAPSRNGISSEALRAQRVQGPAVVSRKFKQSRLNSSRSLT